MSPRLFLQVASIEARRRMSYRVDFWINALFGFAAEFGLTFFVWTALYAESGKTSIGGYTFPAMLVYYIAVLLFSKLVRGVDFDNHVSLDIYEGGLNRYLVFPASYFGFKYAQHVGSLLPAMLQITLFAAVCIPALDLAADIPFSVAGLTMCTASLVLANLLYFLMSFPIQNVAFWADNVWSLLVALRFLTALLGGMMFPLTLFPDWIQAANDWLPFRCLFSVPVEVLLGRLSFDAWAAAMAVGLVWAGLLALLAAAIWRRGNLRYTGIGI